MSLRPGRGPRSRRPQSTRQWSDARPTIATVNPNASTLAGGATATITGEKFAGTPQVFFGVNAATGVVLVSSTSITCVIPAALVAGLVDVTVICNGNTATLSSAFTYAAVTIVRVEPPYGPFAGSTPVVVEGFNFIDGLVVLFDGVPALESIFIDSEHYYAITPSHATGYVTVTLETPPLLFDPDIFDADIFDVEEHSTTVYATLTSGFQYTLLVRGEDIRRNPGIIIQDTLNNLPNKCTLRVGGETNAPVVGEQINITDSFDSDRLLFAGTAQTVRMTYEQDGEIDQLIWNVECIDFAWLLNRRRPVGVYQNIRANLVVIDLIQKFAPSFTTNHVQTNLQRITIYLDGTEDLATVFSKIARMIGGGHWYADYVQDFHFFHIQPALLPSPTQPQTTLKLGPGTAMVVSDGGAIPSTFQHQKAYYVFYSTFIYDNGAESSPSPLSNVLALNSDRQFTFTGVPIGDTLGSLTCVGRRIYARIFGVTAYNPSVGFCAILNNTTTSFSTWGGSTITGQFQSSDPDVTLFPTIVSVQAKPLVAAPVGPSASVSVSSNPVIPPSFNVYPGPPFTPEYSYNSGLPLPAVFTYMLGVYEFKTAFLYQDGTLSLMGPASPRLNIFEGVNYGESATVNVNNIPIGPTINDVPCIARIIFAAFVGITPEDVAKVASQLGNIPQIYWLEFRPSDPWEGGFFGSGPQFWHVVPNNTATSVEAIYPFLKGPDAVVDPTDADPVEWPNPDGPSLEDDDPPQDVDDSNTLLLRDPQIEYTVELSQVRNRIKGVGAGTSLRADAPIGSIQIAVANTDILEPTGGTFIVDGEVLSYTGISALTGEGVVFLRDPMQVKHLEGAGLFLYAEVNDTDSQAALGRAELDVNGDPTDGVHEFVISDQQLTSYTALFMRVSAELELFSRPIQTVVYGTRDPKSRSGQTVHFDLTSPPIKGDFLIQSVTIDQIRSQSDDLSPRYTVTASSVRFELEDLLLALASLSSGSGPQVTGLIPSAVTEAEDADDSDRVPATGRSIRRWTSLAINHDATVADFGTLDAASGTTGGNTVIRDAYTTSAAAGGFFSQWDRFTPNGANVNKCGLNIENADTDGFARWEFRPKFSCVVRTGIVLDGYALPDERVYWIGMSNTEPSAGTRALAKPHIMLMGLYDKAGAAGTWGVTTGRNGSQTITNRGFAIFRAKTVYRLTVEYVSIVAARCTVEDLTRNVTNTVNVTVGGLLSTEISDAQTGLSGYCYGAGVTNLADSNGYFDIHSIYVECD